MPRKRAAPAKRNPVAKFAARFQRAVSFRDRTVYKRHVKHKRRGGTGGD
ncbi:MAG TPA: hypothetical protein VJN91_08895 [Gammaproteobacteria bacterium]|nr:hypothetical protein [Gammaproteobacteria bacterium]